MSSRKTGLGKTESNADQDELEALRVRIPDGCFDELNSWVEETGRQAQQVEQAVNAAFAAAPQSTREEFAAWVREHHADIAAYLFLKYDGKDIRSLIFQHAFAGDSPGIIRPERPRIWQRRSGN